MSTATYTGLRAAVRAGGPKPDDMEPEETAEDEGEAGQAKPKPKGKKKDDEYMTESETNAAIAAARAEGFSAATARANTVLASEHYAGREALATTLLANDKLAADEIITALAAAPKAAVPDAGGAEADDEKARANMRKELAAHQPGITGNDGGEPQAEANHGWANIHDEIAKDRQL